MRRDASVFLVVTTTDDEPHTPGIKGFGTRPEADAEKAKRLAESDCKLADGDDENLPFDMDCDGYVTVEEHIVSVELVDQDIPGIDNVPCHKCGRTDLPLHPGFLCTECGP